MRQSFGRTTGRFISDASAVVDGFFYVSTLDLSQGAGVWGTRDGLSWTRVARFGFGDPATFAAELTGFNGRLYGWASNYAAGPSVWRGDRPGAQP